ncbi:uncharacterized protein LOC144560548 [Carex rostrata]
MAAAEARAAWQRAANRCFVQEDAKRAPKLCPQNDACMNHQTNSHDSDSASDSNEHQQQQLILNLTPVNWNPYPMSMSTANLPADTRWWLQLHPTFAYQKEFLLYEPKNYVPAPHTDAISSSPDFDFDFDQAPKPKTMSFVKHAVQDMKLRYDHVKSSSCEAEKEDPLMPKKKRELWWRVSDGEELASMVAQKAAQQHVENCDLPRPTQTLCCSYSYSHSSTTTASSDLLNSDPSSIKETTTAVNREELLEALCHSQTRAREAEIAAKKALSEKEDIMKLLFKQASHLFACKQWLKVLQLENLCLQLRSRDNKRGSSKSNSKSICRYVVVFAVGWGLASAGVLLGWTLGWLLPKS